MKATTSALAPRLLPSAAYIREAVKLIDKAQRRVTLFTMIITHDKATSALMEALCQAAERGVDVRVTGDIYTFGVVLAETEGHWWSNHGIRVTRQMKRYFESRGVKFNWVGDLGPVLYARRTHLKWCIVDDAVFTFGGVNLYHNGINHADYMLLLHDRELAERLEYEDVRINSSERSGNRLRSHHFACSAGEVLMDGGMFGSSIIYRRACELAAEAVHITFVSQYRPSGRLADLFAATDSELYFNRWQDAKGANKALLMISALFNRKSKTLYKKKRYIHAKYIIFTLANGEKVALTGSHNYVHSGVLLGTREIALETRDPSLIAQLETYHETTIA